LRRPDVPRREDRQDYVSSLLAKLGLERRTQAAVLATRLLGEHPRPIQ
jgi:hypothetical protein